MAEYVKCYLQTLAPIHLGCDEVYEPMGFVLDEQKHRLIVYDPWSFFQEMPDRDKQRFMAICRQGTINSILEIYKFLRGRQAFGRSIEVCSGLVSHYQKTLGLPAGDRHRIQQELNKFTISRTAFLPEDGRPCIPGSAVKGALRTAYLTHMNHEKNLSKGKGKGRELETTLLDGGSFETDPFRLLKVSDFMPVGGVATKIVYAINEKKKPSKFQARGPYQILEVILPGAVFVGSLTFEAPLPGARIRKPLTREHVSEAAADFYRVEKKREDEDLFELGLKPITVPSPEPEFLLRLGRHSGAECLTIAGHRHIKIMQGKNEKPKYLDHATTFWLAAEEDKPSNKTHLQPFGWAALREVSPEMADSFQGLENTWRQQSHQPEPSLDLTTAPAAAQTAAAVKVVLERETWEKASLTWNPGAGELTAVKGLDKALAKGKSLVPEAMHKNLFQKKKAVTAKVTVERLGNAIRIITIE
ncbi:type III-A CRISPR-associated RAMP protein Csm5 [Desulfobacca acetoxidans]